MAVRRVGKLVSAIMVLGLVTAESSGRDRVPDGNGIPKFAVKCGRDSAYLACRQLGIPADPAELDRALGSRSEVSLADLRRALEDKGLFCRAISLGTAELGPLGQLVESEPSRRAAIVALPSRAGTSRHFSLLLAADRESATLLDASAGGQITLRISQIGSAAEIPVLLVGKSDVAINSIGHDLPSLAALFMRALSSPLLTGGITLAIFLVVAPAIFSLIQAYLRWITWAGAFFYCASRLACQRFWRARMVAGAMAVGGGTAVAIHYGGGPNTRAITIEPAQVDLGRVPVGSHQAIDCEVHNLAASSRQIDQIWRSCSCINVDLGEHPVPSGGNAPLHVAFMVPTPGRGEQTISLTAKEDPSRPARLRIQYDAFDAVRLDPVFFNVGEFALGVPTEKIVEVSIEDFDGEPALFGSIKPTGDVHVLDAAFVGPQMLCDGARLKLRLTSRPDVPVCRFAQHFVLSTTGDLERSFVVVTHGAIIPPVRVEPQAVVLAAEGPDGKNPSPSFKVRSLAGPIEIARAVAEPAVVRVDVECASNDETELTLRVHPTDRGALASAGWDSAAITIELARPSREMLRIPVYRFIDVPAALPVHGATDDAPERSAQDDS